MSLAERIRSIEERLSEAGVRSGVAGHELRCPAVGLVIADGSGFDMAATRFTDSAPVSTGGSTHAFAIPPTTADIPAFLNGAWSSWPCSSRPPEPSCFSVAGCYAISCRRTSGSAIVVYPPLRLRSRPLGCSTCQ